MAYATLEGHLIAGEERVVVEMAGDGEVGIVVSAVWIPSWALVFSGGCVCGDSRGVEGLVCRGAGIYRCSRRVEARPG